MSAKAVFVPEGQSKIARRFNAGNSYDTRTSPEGTTDRRAISDGCIRSRPFRDSNVLGLIPGVETPGYSHDVPAGQTSADLPRPRLLHQNCARKSRTFPDNLDVLVRDGCLKPPIEPKSLITGKPYIYIAAGAKNPSKSHDSEAMILLYDDHVQNGAVTCVLANGAGTHVPLEWIREGKVRPN